jgi:hypothetical protein
MILFLVVFSAVYFFVISCGSSDAGGSSMKAEIIEPVIKLVTAGGQSGLSRSEVEKTLELSLWDSYETILLQNKGTWGNSPPTKDEFCVVSDINPGLPIGTQVYVMEEAICLWVLHKHEGKNSRYNLSLTKVKSVETGQEGWTWSKSVKLTE